MLTPSLSRRRAARVAIVLVAGALALAACRPPVQTRPPVRTTTGSVPVMGVNDVSGAQIAAWFNQHAQPSTRYAATVPVAQLAQMFVDEGAAEGVRGDIAFVQSIVETGWFRFGGSVPASYNNFSGLGATGTASQPIARFATARLGIRAQIQHLRRYADSTATRCAVPPLHFACVDPRFDLVVPAGKARTWNQMGNGNWATATTYASSILNLYNDMRAYAGLPRV